MKLRSIRSGFRSGVRGLPLALHFFAIVLLSGTLRASGLQISNPQLDEADLGRITFSVSWQNAWNLDASTAPGNHDAAWVFIKYFDFDSWKHLDLSLQNAHASSDPDRLRIEPAADGKGVFLVPNFSGTGDIDSVQVTLEFAVPFGNLSQIEFLIAGIEMVWVPEGPYYLGDGASNTSFWAGDSSGPFLVDSEATIGFGTGAGELTRDSVSGAAVSVPANWPKGTAGFYCMKYEISQQQYADFLNVLSREQQASRIAVPRESSVGTYVMSPGAPFRNGLCIYTGNEIWATQFPGFGHNLQQDNSFNGEDDGQTRACNWLNWDDLCAYLDWACLRPLTEFEFEKACRGPLPALPLEFAWGTDEILDANTVVFDGTAREGVTEVATGNQGLASTGYTGPQGPLRCGFAAGQGTNRREAGSSYYGIMEMSGNLWEQCVAASPAGLGYRAIPGDGYLNANGNADVESWPNALGAGHRGGGWNSGVLPGFRDLAVSDRFYMGLPPTNRRNTVGGRGGR